MKKIFIALTALLAVMMCSVSCEKEPEKREGSGKGKTKEKRLTGYIVGVENCDSSGYVVISEDLKDTLMVYNFPEDIFSFQVWSLFDKVDLNPCFDNVSFPEQYRYSFKIELSYTVSSKEEIDSLGLKKYCAIPMNCLLTMAYTNYVPVIANSVSMIETNCTDVLCTEELVSISLKLEYPDGRPVLLDSSNIFWVSQNRYLEQDLLSWTEGRKFGRYTIVIDGMLQENQREMMIFTGYLNGEIVCERGVLVGADCCHVKYLGTDPLIQIIQNSSLLKIGEITGIKPGETAGNTQYDLSLRVENINDSRCPTGVNCVWEGNASIQLHLTTQNGQYDFTLDTNPSSMFKTDTLIEGIKYKLVDVLPYPVFGEEQEKTAKILVDNLGTSIK